MALPATQLDERLKSVLELSFFLLVGEPCQAPDVANRNSRDPLRIATRAARYEGAQKPAKESLIVLPVRMVRYPTVG